MTVVSSHWSGVAYGNISGPQSRANQSFLAEQNFRGDEIILDVGCGSGDTTQFMASRLPKGRVDGIDASSSMVDFAIKNNHSNNVSFALCDVAELDSKNKYDYVTSFFCMQWVRNKMDALCRIRKALKKQGCLLLLLPLPHPELPLLREELMASERWQRKFSGYQDPLRFINDCDYRHYLNLLGFKVIDYQPYSYSVSFDGGDAFYDFMKEMTPNLNYLENERDKNNFLNELLAAYLQCHPAQQGDKYNLVFNMLKVKAMRNNDDATTG